MIKSIHLVNIQSHCDTKLDFPQKGVIRIYGSNSAGKTAIFKPFYMLLENRLHIRSVRETLINRNHDLAHYDVEFYTGHAIRCVIAREPNKCLITLYRPSGESITRTLTDKILPSFVDELGIHYDTNRKVSLHIHKTFTPPLFVSTNGVTNYDMLSAALSDSKADKAHEMLDTLLKSWKVAEQEISLALLRINAGVESVQLVDEEKIKIKISNLLKIFNALRHMYIEAPDCRNISFPINIKRIIPLPSPLRSLRLPRKLKLLKSDSTRLLLSLNIDFVKSPKLLRGIRKPYWILDQVRDYRKFVDSINNRICPTCGRSW